MHAAVDFTTSCMSGVTTVRWKIHLTECCFLFFYVSSQGLLGDHSNDSPVLAAQRYRHRDDIRDGKQQCIMFITIMRNLYEAQEQHERISDDLVKQMLRLEVTMRKCIDRIAKLEHEWTEQEHTDGLLRQQDQLESWIFTLRSVTAGRSAKYRALRRIRKWLSGDQPSGLDGQNHTAATGRTRSGRGSSTGNHPLSPLEKQQIMTHHCLEFLNQGGLGTVLMLTGSTTSAHSDDLWKPNAPADKSPADGARGNGQSSEDATAPRPTVSFRDRQRHPVSRLRANKGSDVGQIAGKHQRTRHQDVWPEVRLEAAKLVAAIVTAAPEYSKVSQNHARRIVHALSRYVRDAGGPARRRRSHARAHSVHRAYSNGAGRRRTTERWTPSGSSYTSTCSDSSSDDSAGCTSEDEDKAEECRRRRISEARDHRRFRRQLRAKAVVVAALAHVSTVYHTHDFASLLADAESKTDSRSSGLSKIGRRLGRYFFNANVPSPPPAPKSVRRF